MDNDGVIEATTTAIDVVGYDYLTPLLGFIFGSDGLIGAYSIADAIGVLSSIWSVFIVISYIVSAIFLFLYVYASIHAGELDEEEEHHMHAQEEAFARQVRGGATPNRFVEMQQHLESENPNDWKLAIIEADIMLDESLKRLGYAGTSLGERLRSVSPIAMKSLDDAWEAHKIRNEIAHSGADFVLTHKIARETMVKYERVFAELGLYTEGEGSSSHH